MNSRRQTIMWVALTVIALAAILVLRWHDPPEQPEQPQADPSPTVQEQQTAPLPPTEEHIPDSIIPSDEEVATKDGVIKVCPSEQIMEGFASDYTGGEWAMQVTEESTVEITCGMNAGEYKLHVVTLENIAEDPDLLVETCSNPSCQGAYGFIMLERVP